WTSSRITPNGADNSVTPCRNDGEDREMSAPTTSRTGSDDRPASARISLGHTLTPQSKNYLLVLGTTLFLVGVGLVIILSSSSVDSFLDNKGFFGGFWKQATYAVIGIPLMLVISRIPAKFWKRWA